MLAPGISKLERAPRWTPLPASARALIQHTPSSILLETSRFDPANQRSYIFLHPLRILTARSLNELPSVFSAIEAALASGLHVAGFCTYEAGYHFEHFTTNPSTPHPLPLAWFGVYDAPCIFDHAHGCFQGHTPLPRPPHTEEQSTAAVVDQVALSIPKEKYLASIAAIKDYIAAGDTYQVNFTDAVTFPTELPASTLFAALSRHQSVAYGAFMNVAGHHILSLSPELFFRVDARPDASKITTRPMKGTMPRGLDSAEDAEAILRLQCDEKNRSEHVMIVDLLRNDLGRICTTGSVHVDDLFSVERYETLLQMTSTISGTLRPNTTFYDIFRAMFPCGSITGAPKIRTMQIIRELEPNPRGIYTGAIGFIAPNRSAVFSVAIRTLDLHNNHAHMGIGGGIIADSVPEDEHRECLLKASFLTRAHHPFQLIETMRWDNEFFLLSLHLDRLESSAHYFNFVFDRSAIDSQLHALALTFKAGAQYRVRQLLHPDGTLTLTHSPLLEEPSTIRVKLSPHRTSSTDVFLRHKTTHRQLYDQQYAAARAEGFDEVLFLNERGELTEGAISNLFLQHSGNPDHSGNPEHSGQLLTPPLTSGVLPGIMRRHLLETRATTEERILTLDDLHTADAIFLCNSVRGLRKVTSLSPAAPTHASAPSV
jgi:para-aminobenzoate synthetase/4-amino-4-deoxychorismate lyase